MCGTYPGQVEEEVLGGLDARCGAAALAAWVDEVRRVHQLTTLVTLVPTRIVVGAERTGAFHEAVSEEPAEHSAMSVSLILSVIIESYAIRILACLPK